MTRNNMESREVIGTTLTNILLAITKKQTLNHGGSTDWLWPELPLGKALESSR